MSQAGPSSPRAPTTKSPESPHDTLTSAKDPSQPAAEPCSTSSSQPPSQPEATGSTSTSAPISPRSPTRGPSSSRGTKRSPSVSPVPEESTTTSTSQPPHAVDVYPPTKRSRPPPEPTIKGRGQRLFGMLTSTLTQFKAESESTRSTTAAQRRAEIEARLATKLKQTDSVLSATERKKDLVWEARGIAEEIASGDAQRKTLRGLKRRMASFLFTPPTTSAVSGRRRGERLAPEIPTSTSVGGDAGGYALYFLPGKTLPEQEDKLNKQEDQVDEKIDKFDDGWDERRRQLLRRLEGVKEKNGKI
ncbi:uncharacterized protein UHOD_06868 [Ustilago sp. UG-2017b]|nr:uncharacterized protein UHOD_06868 [Ustilago sp. UG-2017b]